MRPGSFRGDWDRDELPRNVHVGPGCYLEDVRSFKRFRSSLDPGLVIGSDVHIYTWTMFNVELTGYAEIGDRSIIVGAVFMCAERIIVGRETILSYNVTIADSDFHPMRREQRRADAIANAPGGDLTQRPPIDTSPVVVGDGVFVGPGAILLKGVTVGSDARIGPGAVITRDVPAGTSWIGNPARMAEFV